MSSTAHQPPNIHKLSRTDCFRVLGVEPEASWERIRQAYRDLVRVWHPDRFQSDPQLQLRAEQQLQRINEAYLQLKTSYIYEGRQPEPPPEPTPAGPGPAARAHRRAHSGPNGLARLLLFRWPVKATWLAMVFLAPLVMGILLFNALRVPSLESLIPQSGQPRPVILTPSRFVSQSGDVRVTANELSSWARGEAMDLWKSIPKLTETPSASHDVVPREPPAHRDITTAPGTPPNGAEFLRTRMSGGSQLWVSNQADQDAIATLVEADTKSPVRAIYIQAKNKVCIRHIAPGVYNLLAEMGEGWDPSHAHFQASRHALQENGPFQCIDVTSDHVVSGQCVDVSSADGTARTKSNIVLGNR